MQKQLVDKDIEFQFKKMGFNNYGTFKPVNTPYLTIRIELIDSVYKICKEFNLTDQVSHLAIYFMDRINYIDSSKDQNLTMLCCFLLAAKSLGPDKYVPFIPQLIEVSLKKYSHNSVKKEEVRICKLLGWKFQKNTLYDLVDFLINIAPLNFFYNIFNYQSFTNNNIIINFLSQGIVFSFDHKKKTSFINKFPLQSFQINEIQIFHKQFLKESQSLLHLIIQDPNYLTFDLKVVAASVIYYLRESVQFQFSWFFTSQVIRNYEMYQRTGVDQDQIKKTIEKLFPISSSFQSLSMNLSQSSIESQPSQKFSNYYQDSFLMPKFNLKIQNIIQKFKDSSKIQLPYLKQDQSVNLNPTQQRNLKFSQNSSFIINNRSEKYIKKKQIHNDSSILINQKLSHEITQPSKVKVYQLRQIQFPLRFNLKPRSSTLPAFLKQKKN